MIYLFLIFCCKWGEFAFAGTNEQYFNAYQNFTVYKVFPKDEEQFNAVETFSKVYSSDVDLWTELRYPTAWIDIMISPSIKTIFEHELNSLKIKYNIKIDDVSSYIHNQMDSNNKTIQKRNTGFDYNKYHNLEEINEWMDDFARRHSRFVKIFEITKSFEGRPLRAFKISTTKKWSNIVKPAIWIDGCIHAREWISASTVIYITHLLLSRYRVDDYVRKIVDTFDFYILPVFNPDGYKYSWTTRRLWRKSRSTVEGSTCRGVDLNRNWDHNWCAAEGASKEPCSETYCGSAAFSENETRGVAEFLVKNSKSIIAYISFHSYSQLWLSPWSSTGDLPEHFDFQDEGSRIAIEALSSLYKTQYYHGPTHNILYKANGVSIDYTYGIANITFSYVVELRDSGRYGFLLPPNQIKSTALETFEGFKGLMFYFMNFISSSNVDTKSHHLNYNKDVIEANVESGITIKYFYPIKGSQKLENSAFSMKSVKFKVLISFSFIFYFLLNFTKF